MDRIRVGVNGYGVIGRRVADALMRQDDMTLVGVTKASPDYSAAEAGRKGIGVYALKGSEQFEKMGISTQGALHDLLPECDVVIDCSPKGKGAENLRLYRNYRSLKAIFQGGEHHGLTNISFNAQCNYDSAVNKNYVRIVSCNTTALCRVLNHVDRSYGIMKARVALVRRSTDPSDSEKGPINAWVPDSSYPSHHATDVQTVLPGLKVTSLAGTAPMTLMHGHMLFAELKSPATRDEVADVLEGNRRIMLVSKASGFSSTAQIKDFAHTNGRSGNMYEVCVWKDSIGIDSDNELGMHLAIDQQADVIPENIDAIRAMFSLMDAESSMDKTNRSLGMK
ncbi:type II glyceraldehyde-3-phosphate dehydrogenase [Candidatus Woesearchaeota archaeon]|nr:type II glyceraldehyde-3-phosphate dehydrogenase [Candidatus Woesearchaeota archaeon]